MAHGFIAYDCNGPKINITSFNSLYVESCDPPSEINTQMIQRIQLLQKTDTYLIPYKACSIIINYFISRCSLLEDAQMVDNGFFTEIIELGSARCSELHKKLIYHLPNGGIITGLKINETTLSAITVAGFVDRNGNCKGTTFSSDKGTWQEAIVQANYKITLTEGLAIVNHKQNTLTLPTGSTLKLSNQYGLDNYKGETDLIQKQCELERKVLLHKLTLATYSLSEFAYSMGEGPGYTALKAGEIIYLLKCKPVEVEISSKNTVCYDELPVFYNNQSYFMAPKTRTLQKFGTEIDCNHILPSAFLLDGEWYTTSQNIREIKRPQTLKPSTKWTWTYKSIEHLMTAGIYNYETMKQFQQYLILPQEIEASQKNLARQTMGFTIMDHRLNLNSLIDENTISNMVDNKLKKMWVNNESEIRRILSIPIESDDEFADIGLSDDENFELPELFENDDRILNEDIDDADDNILNYPVYFSKENITNFGSSTSQSPIVIQIPSDVQSLPTASV
ncbi:hypothetical protein QTP88_025082 [Uroleucon formosanum]